MQQRHILDNFLWHCSNESWLLSVSSGSSLDSALAVRDYLLSAAIMSEYTNKKTYSAFIAAVFSRQGLGISAGGMVLDIAFYSLPFSFSFFLFFCFVLCVFIFLQLL